ncbi:uncharacterized protein LOC123566282 isoform X1 [Mercenaria mercenaria]|uniref:uncharacterized protein LOC123566282 isoform X1 n=1 Tax=Mercenaria mercenaria TaxID=6596 RepID=UPI00234F2892|nr:uncharacterized protein LOC123566282 isoform X1 [Mercenaria mercenaria]
MGRFFIAAIILVVYASTTYAYRYVGCYEDNSERILGRNFSSDDCMTVEKCVQTCSYEGANFGGVQYAHQCFCGARLKRGYKKLADSACSTNCAGDSSQKCGGGWKISVYATNNYLGCFVDNPGRILEGPSTNSSQMTTKTCLKFCKKAGKRFALTQVDCEGSSTTYINHSRHLIPDGIHHHEGMREEASFCPFNAERQAREPLYSRYCFCGNKVSEYKQKADSECNFTCAGAKSEKCGGAWRGSLYVV